MYEMLRRVQADGNSITDAAASFGFSRPSFYQAQAAFEQDGLAGLVPRQRGPKQAHKLTDEVLAFISADCISASALGARPARACTIFTQGAKPPWIRRLSF